MILGLMQPYFFPYLGYFDLINYSDRWIVFDLAQYIKLGWVNRNRILHPKEGWQYITVPVKKHSHDTLIKDIRVSDGPKWRKRILGQIQHYRKTAPYFRESYQLVEECMTIKNRFLSNLNVAFLDKVCSYLGIPFEYEYLSDMSLELGPIKGPDDWALQISYALGAKEYVNPPGGVSFFNPIRFEALGIKLTIRNIPLLEYGCGNHNFVPMLSIIDVLMWNPPEKVKYYLDKNKTQRLD